MTELGNPQSFAGGEALLARLRADIHPGDHLAIDLSVALGILIADEIAAEAKPNDMTFAIALAHAIILAASSRRRAMRLVADCVGRA